MQYAPIALFTYSRADHTRLAVESLLKNEEAKDSDLFIFSDGPKAEEKRTAVEDCRKYIHTISGFKSITIVERERNWGLANSLIAGITEVIQKYGKIIVVEDDIVVSPYFLKFMNSALGFYEDKNEVGAIAAHVPDIHEDLPTNFFLTYFQCWGWATWKRSWDLLTTDTKYLLRKLRFKMRKFDMNTGAYGNLYCQKVGLVDSWYVRFYASLFLSDKLTLFPGKSLVVNVGCDGSGTHSRTFKGYNPIEGEVFASEIEVLEIPIEENSNVSNLFRTFYMDVYGDDKKVKTCYYAFKSFVRRLLYIDCC